MAHKKLGKSRQIIMIGLMAWSVSGMAMAQGVPMTNVPTMPSKIDSGNIPNLSNIPSSSLPGAPKKPDEPAVKEPTREEIEVSYMMALGGQAYMKQFCGDGSWRQEMEAAQLKLQPENRVNGVRGFRAGWTDSKKRFGSDINICDKVKGSQSAPVAAASQPAIDQAQPTKPVFGSDMSLNSLMGGDGSVKLQPTAQKPE
jgi:predicted secreted protein